LSEKAHLTKEGLQEIINLKASLNKGLSDLVSSEFTKTKPVKRAIIEYTELPEPHWIAGFVSGEGNFDAGIRKATNTRPERVYLRFRITQKSSDLELMNLIIDRLGAGRIEWDKRTENNAYVHIVVGNFN
jgi:hypothetical protein